MSLLDQIVGKAKQMVGQGVDDASMRREGRKQEKKGEAKEQAARAEEKAEQKAEQAARLDEDR